MKKSSILFFLVSIVCFFVGYSAFADARVVVAAAPDLGTSLLALWQAIQTHAGIALILVPVFQILKTSPVVGLLNGLGGKAMQVAVALITVGGFIVNAWATGQNLGAAAIAGLFTSGGAMLIYQAFTSIPSAAAAPVASAPIVVVPPSA